MISSLLATKTFLPSLQGQLVSRSRLVERLNAGLQQHHRLFLISSFAGSGKSTLMAEWAASTPIPMAWVSVDAEDNDPIRFWTYISAAVMGRYPGSCQSVFDMLRSAQPPPVSAILPELVNQLSTLPGELILALDDYHVISSKVIHESLTFFLEHLPPNIHIAITTRSDPPLPVHRWRARNQLTEIRYADLRFTLDEAYLYLANRMRLPLKSEDVEKLEKRTEGWIVGLHLAALLMQNSKDPYAFISRFSSNNQYILEYLTNEVLDMLPEDEQAFLLQISILPQFNSSLCEAVTGRSDSPSLLNHFWKANLFIIPLDDENYWYRYHHMFADLLSQRLKQKGEEEFRTLHQRAADWYVDHGMIDDAIRSALAAGNYTMAADLTLQNRRQAMNAGDLKRYFHWMEQIPKEVLAADARLSLAYAVMLYNNGQTDPVEEHLANAQKVYDRLARDNSLPPEDPDYATLPGQIASVRAMLALRRWDLTGAARYAEETLRLALAEDLHTQGMAGIALGLAQSEMGRFEEAIQTYRKAIPTCEQSGNWLGAAVCHHHLARLLLVQRQLTQAEETCDMALASAARRGQEQLPATGVMIISQAEIWYEARSPEQVRERIEEGVTLIQPGGYLDIQKTAAILKAKLSAAAGNLPAAVQELNNIYGSIQSAGMGPALTELDAYLAYYHALMGDLESAARWADTQDTKFDHPGYTRGIELFCLAKIWMLTGKMDLARNLLVQLEKYAAQSQSKRREISARLLLALLAFQQNHRAESFELLAESIRTGRKLGYRRLFLDEGWPLRDLLREFLKSGRCDQEMRSFAQDLLASLSTEEIQTPEGPPAGSYGQILSERELEVLRLAAQGLTNPEIAQTLIVAVSTVKTHLNNIYIKLEARNRAEAVLRAKERQLL